MTAGAMLLRTLRSATVLRADCKVSKAGKLQQQTSLKTGDRTVTVSGSMHTHAILATLGMPKFALSRAAGREIERLQKDQRTAIESHPAYAQVMAQRSKHHQLGVLTNRASKLAAGAVQQGVTLADLLNMIEERWQHHTVLTVMET